MTAGFPLSQEGGEVGEMDVAAINTFGNTDVDGVMIINIVKSEKFCHGTLIHIKDLTTGIESDQYSTEKSHVHITGCIPGHEYEVKVAYDGTNKTRKYSPTRKKICS